ncbi:hypothetical protein COT48_02220, partial [Candidatus Woesearchaeota archaeon CG08_land_8_20_14_0_20_47_9]
RSEGRKAPTFKSGIAPSSRFSLHSSKVMDWNFKIRCAEALTEEVGRQDLSGDPLPKGLVEMLKRGA